VEVNPHNRKGELTGTNALGGSAVERVATKVVSIHEGKLRGTRTKVTMAGGGRSKEKNLTGGGA